MTGRADISALAAEFALLVGEEHISTDPVTLERLSTDLSLEVSASAAVAVSPADEIEVSSVVRAARRAGVPVAARGAARSYTLAHTPSVEDVVLLDCRRLDRISVNADDLYVNVGVGCSWERLYLALREQALRVPSWGPLSGRSATIGGTLSQNGAFYGSALYGTAAENVLGLELVLADGRLLRTGSAARRTASPFARYYGPDLSGLFLADSGTFGIKTQASLALIPEPVVSMGTSFGFGSLRETIDAMSVLARLRVASDIFAFDAFYHMLLRRFGFTFLDGHRWSVHVMVEGADAVVVERTLDRLRQCVGSKHEIDGSVPAAMRADPFGIIRAMFRGGVPGSGASAVHLPLHAVVPLSQGHQAVAAMNEFLKAHEALMRQHSVTTWTLATVVGKDLLIEPAFCIEGNRVDLRAHGESRQEAVRLRHALADIFGEIGAIHMQVGKFYTYLPELHEASGDVLRAVKGALDLDMTLNPGALGL